VINEIEKCYYFHHIQLIILCFHKTTAFSNYKITFAQNHCTSIQFEKTFQNTLSSLLYDCIAILSEEDNRIHIIGGLDVKRTRVSTHMKTKVCEWDPLQLVKICLFICFDQTLIVLIINNEQSKNEIKYKLGWVNDFDEIIMK
ncbi:hypothetical protein RFI_36830, partial [Reticulomyxa filosa]